MEHGVVTELSFFLLSCGRRTSLGGLDDGNIDESALVPHNPPTIKNGDGTRLAKIYRGIEVFLWLMDSTTFVLMSTFAYYRKYHQSKNCS